MANRVIIIGAGLAGMMAAYAAQQSGAEVVLVDRSGLGLGSNSAMSNGRFAGPTSAYSAEDLVRDTLRVGKRINHVSHSSKPSWSLLESIILPSRPSMIIRVRAAKRAYTSGWGSTYPQGGAALLSVSRAWAATNSTPTGESWRTLVQLPNVVCSSLRFQLVVRIHSGYEGPFSRSRAR